uniref:Homeobox-leucine zipper protein n=1 Tax=Triticum urartu TaxID=4572 RepID=A0A8R7VER2_TRIUA
MEPGRLIFNTSGSGNGQMLFMDCGAGGIAGAAGMFHRGVRPVLGGMEEGRGVKRPFFTSPDDMLEEEYYDEQLPEKKRRLTPEQVHLLERSFEEENKLEPERKTELARKLGLQAPPGGWRSGPSPAAPGGRQRRWSATSTASRRPSTPSAPTTTRSSRTTTGSGHRW